MSDQITYDNKVDLQVATNIANINKVTASDMNEIKSVVNTNAEEVGDTTSLTTTDKTSVVNAINEIAEEVGDTTSLTTTDKTSVVNAINEINAPGKWVSVGTTAPTDGRKVWFEKGNNLFNKNIVIIGGRLDVSGGITTQGNCFYSNFISVKANTTYTKNSPGEDAYHRVCFYSDANVSGFISKSESNTFTTPENCKYLRFCGYNIEINTTMLEEGSSATTYEPYIEPSIIVDGEEFYKKNSIVEINNTQPINGASLWVQPTTENLIDYRNFQTRTYNGIDIANNHDGTFTINGTATADISAVISDAFLPMSGTWRMLGCPSGGSSSTYMLSAYVGYWGGGSPNIDTGSGTNITYTGNVKIKFFIKSGTNCNNLIFKPMLTTDTSTTIDNFAPKGPNIYALINGQYQVV